MSASPLPAGRGAGLLLALAGSIAFSGKAIIVKLAYRYGVDAVTVIMYRMLFSLPLFLALAWWATYRSGQPVRPLDRRDWLGILGLGFTGHGGPGARFAAPQRIGKFDRLLSCCVRAERFCPVETRQQGGKVAADWCVDFDPAPVFRVIEGQVGRCQQ